MAWVEAMADDPEERAFEEYRQGLVDGIDDGVATVLVGVDLEEWEFPAHLLPADAREGTVLRLHVIDDSYEAIDIDPSVKPLEERLGRGLNRKRPIVFPLPHREHLEPVPADEIAEVSPERASRLARGLNHG
jgi:hypothetical protein